MTNYNKYTIWQYAFSWLTIRNDSPKKCRYNALYESPCLVTTRGLVFILYVYVTILLRIHDILIHSFMDRKVQWFRIILRNRTTFPTICIHHCGHNHCLHECSSSYYIDMCLCAYIMPACILMFRHAFLNI